jgi:hypothetical protein
VLCGDFDVQVDFAVTGLVAGVTGGIFASMRANDPTVTTNGMTIERYAAEYALPSSQSYQNYKSYTTNKGDDATSVLVPTTDVTGRFRLTRTGTTVKSYYWKTGAPDGQWVLVNTATLTNTPWVLVLYEGDNSAANKGPTAPYSVTFSNLLVTFPGAIDAGTTDGSIAGGADSAGGGPGTCANGDVPAAVFDDDFAAGLRSNYWTVSQTTSGLFAVDTSQGDVRLTKVGTNSASGVQNVAVNLNLAAIAGQVVGDFDFGIDFKNAVLGNGGTDQVELHAYFADSAIFFDVYDNSSGVNVHVWNGSSVIGATTITGTGGTFRIVRTGSTVSGYFGNTMIYTATQTSALTAVEFTLQLQPGVNDNISVQFDNFHFRAGCSGVGGRDGGIAGGADSAGGGPGTCPNGGVPAAVFDDDFAAGLRSNYWTVSQTTSGLFAVDTSQGDVRLTKVGTNSASGVQNVAVNLNLAAIAGQVVGDFDFGIDFKNAVLGNGGTDQVELHAYFADSAIFFDVYDNSSGVNVHVWNGSSVIGATTITGTGGTFRIVRTGSTVSGYFGNTMIYTATQTSALTAVEFTLQLQPGVNDNISVQFDNFHFRAGCPT